MRKHHLRLLARLAVISSLALLAAAGSIAFAGSSGAVAAHQPDAWIKLCGPTNTCIIQPWHPWVGTDVYSATGKGEKVSGGVEEGNMIRFWIAIQNDSSTSSTFKVKGCSGTSAFPVKIVNVGPYRAYTGSHNVTSAFKGGSLKFSPAPGHLAIIAVTFTAATSTKGATYSCPITVRSTQSTAKDRVVASMVTI